MRRRLGGIHKLKKGLHPEGIHNVIIPDLKLLTFSLFYFLVIDSKF